MKNFMVPAPCTITQDLPLYESLEIMESYQIRHLPVEYRGDLVGVLLYSDVRHSVSSPGLGRCSIDHRSLHYGSEDHFSKDRRSNRLIAVEEIMIRNPCVVHPDSDLSFAVSEMDHHKQDYAIVHDGIKIVGIFTITDAFKVLSDLIKTRSNSRAA